jgi:hypothetical protein
MSAALRGRRDAALTRAFGAVAGLGRRAEMRRSSALPIHWHDLGRNGPFMCDGLLSRELAHTALGVRATHALE